MRRLLARAAAAWRRPPRVLWLDLGEPGVFARPAGPLERWQDHGLGLLRTILQRAGVPTGVASLRSVHEPSELARVFESTDTLVMNVRSSVFPLARDAAAVFKRIRPRGRVVVGGIHATVAPAEMEAVEAFDHICRGPGERTIVPVLRDPAAHPRLIDGTGSRSMDEWPPIDRTLWPNPGQPDFPWPLEPACGWGPPPVATVLTSRSCPWACAFCNESSYIPATLRRSPLAVIEELNEIDRRHGPIGSVVIHDSMFFQHPRWLEAWLELYPRRARRPWPYWAAARSDTIRRWPELFEALISETNWNTVSVGFESGSDRMLQMLNKECTVDDHLFAIELVNRIGDERVRQGQAPPVLWANVILAIPGETREEALDTMRLTRLMRYRQLSPSFFSPYPGSALGWQLMAEGASLLTPGNYHRHPSGEKLRGIDYGFYRDLLAGRHDHEVESRTFAARQQGGSVARHQQFYLFEEGHGRRTLAYGTDPGHALDLLRARRAPVGTPMPAAGSAYSRISQRDLPACVPLLGRAGTDPGCE